MKRTAQTRPRMLLYLLVGALVLSTAFNFYCLLRLETHAFDQELEAQLRVPTALLLPPDSLQQPAAAPADSLLAAQP
ncbi:hypothetical protein ACFP2F_07290 [Hymenobacter artigasi]|uniref:Uncharacterized protein n=1 Tax=Hymenobacter artigasi TaxID=2719616 RepID=A0ABX1HHY4_9BACT|nr:hypothetical protein [Hymenobacter artigasi]NKI88672.1 hypothetical protein [Hymenobacter artigasi]